VPEPVVESGVDEADDVTLPLLMAPERLSPLERAAFPLHDVFGLDFEEVATMIERDSEALGRAPRRAVGLPLGTASRCCEDGKNRSLKMLTDTKGDGSGAF
jgi:hypothetical protein